MCLLCKMIQSSDFAEEKYPGHKFLNEEQLRQLAVDIIVGHADLARLFLLELADVLNPDSVYWKDVYNHD